MVLLTFSFRIVCGNDKGYVQAGAAFDQPLPVYGWRREGYFIGFVVHGGTISVQKDLAPGRHYVVFGTGSNPSFIIDGQPAHLMVETVVRSGTGSVITTTSAYQVHQNKYAYMVFDVSPAGTLTRVSEGNVDPDKAPHVEGVSTTTYILNLKVESGGSVTVTRGSRVDTYTGPTAVNIAEKGGTVFTLEAHPASGYAFNGWYDDGNRISGYSNITFSLTQNRTIRASFTAETTPPTGYYRLTVYVSGGGKLYVNETPYTSTATQLTFTSGTSVTLKAVPDQNYKLEKFEVDGTPVTTSSTTIVMNTNRTVSVSFVPLMTEGGGGSGGFTFDASQIVKQMMEQMMPPMMQMMGMAMMMQMMAGLMAGMAGAFAGGV